MCLAAVAVLASCMNMDEQGGDPHGSDNDSQITLSVRGKVVDASDDDEGNGIEGILVRVLNTETTSTTNPYGVFTIEDVRIEADVKSADNKFYLELTDPEKRFKTKIAEVKITQIYNYQSKVEGLEIKLEPEGR